MPASGAGVDHADLSHRRAAARIEPDMFDVVIVDEASQAGLEATFLQYLAPKIVVIGDDKQVSPSAVGVDQQQLRDLANQYLRDDRYRASWQDPQRSLFDEAKMRFGGLITLIEHRRCVPEIIGFSNRIAYEPDGIRLVPVRQFGADRLDPISAVHVAEGYEARHDNKINPPRRRDRRSDREVPRRPAVRRADVRRDLAARHGPGEADRGASCSNASRRRSGRRASCAAATRPTSRAPSATSCSCRWWRRPQTDRLTALTRGPVRPALQRRRVAGQGPDVAVPLVAARGTLTNTEDMRFQLLDYCYGVSQRRQNADDDGMVTAVVPEDVRVRALRLAVRAAGVQPAGRSRLQRDPAVLRRRLSHRHGHRRRQGATGHRVRR